MSKKAKGPISLCAYIADMHVPFQIVGNCYTKIFHISFVIKDSIDLFDPFPCNLHDIADWLESHAPFLCPTAKAIYILLKFHSVLCTCTFDFTITNTSVVPIVASNRKLVAIVKNRQQSIEIFHYWLLECLFRWRNASQRINLGGLRLYTRLSCQ